ncbi:MAG: hypothetical protein WBZ15_25000 [Mycobacterium sp.]|uniref:hypothetical protein n=1 Tax=Mycobacterium sp. TaxID=1785 RepID=UPI003C6AED0E
MSDKGLGATTMQESFKAALARVQSDYDFYVGCQIDPDKTLADYDLSPDERSALSDPEKLADVLKPRGWGITIKISGSHDWVNRTGPKKPNPKQEHIRREVEAIELAGTEKERTEAAVRLMELIG